MTTELTELKNEADRALLCLYIAVEKHVADDVNAKVRAYINALSKAKQPTTDIIPPSTKK